MLFARLFMVSTLLLLVFYVDKLKSAYVSEVQLPVNGAIRVCCGPILRIISIGDSRCPSNVVCVRAGEARVEVRLSRYGAFSTVKLEIGPDAQLSNTAQITLNYVVYTITLKDVIPYPVHPRPNNYQPKAVIEVNCP